MSLTEIMSGAGLTLYPIVALVLFLFAFGIIIARTLGRQNAARLERFARIPLENDEHASTPRTRTPGSNGGAP